MARLRRLNSTASFSLRVTSERRQRDVPASHAEAVLDPGQLHHELPGEALGHVLPLLLRHIDANGLGLLVRIMQHIAADGIHVGVAGGA